MFNKVTQPHFPRFAVGLRREGVSVVSLAKQGRHFALRRAASVDLPAGVVQPSFTETNVLRPAELIAAIQDAATSAGLQNQKRWSASLPADAARMNILTLEVEPKTGKELREVINWKAERTFGAGADEMRLAYQSLSADANNRKRYFAVAVRNDVLAEYEEIFAALAWNVGLVLPRHLSEAQWLMLSPRFKATGGDALMVSSQADGFMAMLLQRGGQQPALVRSVMCEPEEREDELYRLLLYYRDRLADEKATLDKFLVVGEGFDNERVSEISHETLGRELRMLQPADVGLLLPGNESSFSDVSNELSFAEIAAPAALASLALR